MIEFYQQITNPERRSVSRQPIPLSRRLGIICPVILALILASCSSDNPAITSPVPEAAAATTTPALGPRSFFDGDLVAENNRIPVIVECLPRNGKSSIVLIDYPRGVVVLHNAVEMPLKGPSKSLATVVGDMETDIAVLAVLQSKNGSSSVFLTDSKEFVEGVSAKRFRTGIFEADLPIDPYSDDDSVQRALPDQIVEICHQ